MRQRIESNNWPVVRTVEKVAEKFSGDVQINRLLLDLMRNHSFIADIFPIVRVQLIKATLCPLQSALDGLADDVQTSQNTCAWQIESEFSWLKSVEVERELVKLRGPSEARCFSRIFKLRFLPTNMRTSELINLVNDALIFSFP